MSDGIPFNFTQLLYTDLYMVRHSPPLLFTLAYIISELKNVTFRQNQVTYLGVMVRTL